MNPANPTQASVSAPSPIPERPKKRPRVPKGQKRCSWQGYGFGARYEDAACCDGRIGDLDDVQGPGLIGLRDDYCPNCNGSGVVPNDHEDRGPMALHRQRQRDELYEDIMGIAAEKGENAKEWAEEVAKRVDGLWKLEQTLEEK